MAEKNRNQVDPNARPLAERLSERWGIDFNEALETINHALSKGGTKAKQAIDSIIFSDSAEAYRKYRRDNALKSGQGHKNGSRRNIPGISAPPSEQFPGLNPLEAYRPPSKEEFTFPGSIKPQQQSEETSVSNTKTGKSASGGSSSARASSSTSKRVKEVIPDSPNRTFPTEFDFDKFNEDIRSKILPESSKSTASDINFDNELDARRARTQRDLSNLSQALGMAIDLGNSFAARRDRRRAENLRSQISQPTYGVRGPNMTILSEMRDAQMRRINPYGQVAPVADQINLGYQQDLNAATNVSGGQASTLGGLSAAAALRRDRNLSNLAGAAIGAIGAQDERIMNLTNLQSQDEADRDRLNLSKFNINQQRALMEGQAVGNAIASSRVREIQGRTGALDRLLGSNAFDVNTYSDLIRKNLIRDLGK